MTTVDRRAVQELIEREIEVARRCNMPAAVIGLSTVLEQVKELPSSNAQAVAWQCRYKGSEKWEGCTETEYNNRLSPVMMRVEYRALCVCSGDAKEA